jgi:hypothetical protein
MAAEHLNGIPRVDPTREPNAYQRLALRFIATKAGTRIHRAIGAPLDGALSRASGGRFVARRTEGADRDRLYALAERHYSGYATYTANTDGVRTIPVLRLAPAA